MRDYKGCKYELSSAQSTECARCLPFLDRPNWSSPESPIPPIGLMPRKLYIEQRFADVTAAIARYAEARMAIPAEWISELDEWWKELN